MGLLKNLRNSIALGRLTPRRCTIGAMSSTEGRREVKFMGVAKAKVRKRVCRALALYYIHCTAALPLPPPSRQKPSNKPKWGHSAGILRCPPPDIFGMTGFVLYAIGRQSAKHLLLGSPSACNAHVLASKYPCHDASCRYKAPASAVCSSAARFTVHAGTSGSKPGVILIGWLGAHPKHLAKYGHTLHTLHNFAGGRLFHCHSPVTYAEGGLGM